MELKTSPLAPKTFATLSDIDGVEIYALEAGIKYKNRPDVLFAKFAEGTTCAGVFTKSHTCSFTVDWSKDAITRGAKALVVNAGNANAFTGEQGVTSVRETAEAAAKIAGCEPQDVAIASTGVIGVPLMHEKIVHALQNLDSAKTDWDSAAKSICTTDTFLKKSTEKIGGATINGFAKGSGMIAPNMATMLGYIFTDAKLPAMRLQEMLGEINIDTFNAISVDSDTSTNDMCLAFATGKVEVDEDEFQTALHKVMLDLAQQIIRDGEGASKFVEIEITGATTKNDARKIAASIGNSPILKTAIAGEDANWGRIVMAIGKTDVQIHRERLKIRIGGILVAEHGAVHPDYVEADLLPHMKGQEISISVDIGEGDQSAKFWTCDLTHTYIDINGDYRS